MRYHLQRVLTGEWLSRDFDLAEGVTTRALSAPGGVAGKVAPELQDARHTDGLRILERWGTAIYAEDDGVIRGAGIFTGYAAEGETLSFDAPGFAGYPAGLTYDAFWPEGGGVRIDPLTAVRHIWEHVQSYPNGNLGMVVDNTESTATIGTNEEPYRLRWYDQPDCGSEIDSLAETTPFDYREEHRWADRATKAAVTHRLRIGFPRLGRRREDLRFVEGENITGVIPVEMADASHANEVLGIGHGEGSTMNYVRLRVVDGRLRRPITVTDKTADKQRIGRIAAQTLRRYQHNVEDIGGLDIIDHPNARVAEIDPGDDIHVEVQQPHLGRLRMWVRVLSIAEPADGYTASLSVQRSSTFIYSATTEVGGE